MKVLSDKILATEELEDFSVMTVNEFGDKIWKDKDRQLHREDGPAIDCADGNSWYRIPNYKAWYQHGKLHREDGPAEEYADGDKYWHLNDQSVSEDKVRALGKIQ